MAADIADFLDPLGLGSAIAAQFEKEGSPERSEQRPPAAALRCVQTAANACQRLPSPPPMLFAQVARCRERNRTDVDLERIWSAGSFKAVWGCETAAGWMRQVAVDSRIVVCSIR